MSEPRAPADPAIDRPVLEEILAATARVAEEVRAGADPEAVMRRYIGRLRQLRRLAGYPRHDRPPTAEPQSCAS